MKKNLRIVFFGTPEFAVSSLDILVKNNYSIAAVVTAPDKPAGRGQKLQESAVKKYAIEKGIKILQPEKLKDKNFIEELKTLNANLQVIVAFRMLPEEVWKMPALGTFNLHASLLPQYRGAAPINWAIINGEKTTGITTFFLQHEIDTGKIIFSEEIPIEENATAGELHDKLMHLGAQLVLKTASAIESGNYPSTDQKEILEKNQSILKTAPKIYKENCRINWNKTVDEIHNLIRGLSPYPGAWTEIHYQDKSHINILKVLKAHKEWTTNTEETGKIMSDNKNYIKISVPNGFIYLEEIQLAGKKAMNIKEFLKGNKIDNSWYLK